MHPVPASTGELTTVTMPPALVAGFETVVFFALFFLFPQKLVLLFGIMTTMVALNIVQRLLWACEGAVEFPCC